MIKLFIYHKEVFCAYILNNFVVFASKKYKLANLIKIYLLNLDFWSKLDNLITILRLIYKTPKFSKFNNAIINQIYKR